MRIIMLRMTRWTVAAVAAFVVTLSANLCPAFEDVEFVREITSILEEPFDVAVTENKEILVLDRKAGKVVVFNQTGALLREIGSRGSGEGQFKQPESLLYNPTDQTILVADTGNNRVQAFNLAGDFLYSFGESGRAPGQFQKPAALARDRNGFILVADAYNNRIQGFSPKGIFRFQIPFADRPADVSVDADNQIYVLIPGMGRVMRITELDRQTLFACVAAGKNAAQDASGLNVSPQGNVYVVNPQNNSIKKFSANQTFMLSFGSEGESRGQFDSPAGIETDEDGFIYIADSRNKRVQVLQLRNPEKGFPQGRYQKFSHIRLDKEIPAVTSLIDIKTDGQGNVYALSDKEGYLLAMGFQRMIIGEKGGADGQLRNPQAFDLDSGGKIYIADTGNNRVQVFDGSGQFLFTFGKRGSKNGQFDGPAGIAVNSRGFIYVSDTDNNRIQMFNRDGIFMLAFGERSDVKKDELPAPGTFDEPGALALDSLEQLNVLDRGNSRVQVFESGGEFLKEFGTAGEAYQQFQSPT
ncbi:MAG: 6-bladed beta-propeller, partial [Candidatus Omnitrophica bacterium]|nr:6-bladed beta-propeller [Candidatus Omnitrophota bacterium]